VRQAPTSPSPASRTALRAIPPGLHLVSTPIGAARDITLHALDVLAGADVLVAEDTRTLRHLMEIHGIAVAGRPVLSYHDHSGEGMVGRILQALSEDKSVAYASEAGTPLISDPGFELARAVAAAGLPMTAAPGPCAAICALTLSGLPTDRFLFAGFAPATAGDRQRFLAELAAVPATVIVYDSPRRVAKTLTEMATAFGPDRPAALCRELTKRFETILRGTVAELADKVRGTEIKGEVVLVVDRAPVSTASPANIEAAVDAALASMSVKDAASFVSQTLGISRKLAYQIALDRSQG
jgi:16S rRNA (cytidine1402-2'-O)-methyltransferase